MVAETKSVVLRGAHVIDPSQGLDRIADVVVRDGRIAAVGGEIPTEADIVDLDGHYLSPGWIDIHIHAYGTLGFADPDSIGIWQGVTSYVDAGGPGIGVLEEFSALLEGEIVTDLYAGPYIRPLGIIGAQYIEGELRSLGNFPVTEWIDFMTAHPGLVRYLKVAALGSYGTGPLKMGKGLAEIIGVPLYGHIGEFQQQPDDPSAFEIFNICERGDIITHMYHANGPTILDDDGRILPIVREAAKRGVVFDVGFGGFNFCWDVATQAFTQDFRPDIISSDLQQYNVIGPVFSLAHIMGIFRHLGMTVAEVIEAVTWSPAKVLSLTDRAGSLKPGMPADITVFRTEAAELEVADTYEKFRTVDQRFLPVMAFKNGVRYDCNMTMCQDEKNWLMLTAEDHVPEAARQLSSEQYAFLRELGSALEPHDWSYDLNTLDLREAEAFQALFHKQVARQGLPLKSALKAVFACFHDSPFTMQSGLFILQLNKEFALKRLHEVAGDRKAAA